MKKCIPLFSILLICLLLNQKYGWAQDGSLDISFDTDGKVSTKLGTLDDDIYAIAVQADGKIVVAGHSYNGSNYDFAVARYNSNGSLDNTFDTDGKLSTTFGSFNAKGRSLAIQSDGKIVVAGISSNGTFEQFAVARYNTDGSLDNSFDGDGKVSTLVGSSDANGNSVVIQSDGKIVVGGFGRSTSGYDFAVVRYNSNGSLDDSFDTDGIAITDIGTKDDIGRAIAIQSSGKLVLAGYSKNVTHDDFALVRYNSDGSLDNSFDTDGKVTTGIVGSFNEYANAIAIQKDDKIVVAGSSNNSFYDFNLVRYNNDGSLDNSFDTDGKVSTDFGSSTDKGEAIGMLIQKDGKIVITGNVSLGATLSFAVLRYLSNGSLDNTFDSDGIVTTVIGTNLDGARATTIQSDGKILAAGSSYDGAQTIFALARYNNTVVSSNIPLSTTENNSINIWPNPFSEQTIVNSNIELKNAVLTLYSALGQIVLQKENIEGRSIIIDRDNLPNGLYWLNIRQNGQTLTNQKLIINP